MSRARKADDATATFQRACQLKSLAEGGSCPRSTLAFECSTSPEDDRCFDTLQADPVVSSSRVAAFSWIPLAITASIRRVARATAGVDTAKARQPVAPLGKRATGAAALSSARRSHR